jgi:hypothetical protein
MAAGEKGIEGAGAMGNELYLLCSFVCSHLWRRRKDMKVFGSFGSQENHSINQLFGLLCPSFSI